CERLDAALASPLAQQDPERGEAWTRHVEPAEVVRLLREQDGLEASLQWHGDPSLGAQLQRVERLGNELARAARGVMLEPGELWAVGELADALTRLSTLVQGPDEAVLAVATETARQGFMALVDALPGLRPQAELAAALSRAIAFEGSQGEPVVADSASPALARARAQVRADRQALVRRAERLVRGTDLVDALADRFWTQREGRVVLPVRSSGFSRAGSPGTVSGIIHGSSTSGHTLFVEPTQLVDDNNRLREAQMAARAEERRVLTELSARVGEHASALGEGLVALQRLDRVRARWLVGEALDAVAPQVVAPDDPEATVELPAARHPLMVLSGVEVVPNDLRVRRGGGLVVSGVNAGGKTVALKTLGLCVLMTQAGLRLPTCSPARVPLFRHLVTEVGDDQSISANLSTFSAHIGHVIEALRTAAEDPAGTLVLLDEVAVGTDPEQGAALAEAILRELSGRGATVVVTTHYERLKLLALGDPPGLFENAAVGFDLEHLRPTFELRMGVPGSSSAIAVARRLGVDEAVLRRAEAMLSDERLRVDSLLQALEAERVALQQEREGVAAQRAAVEAAEARLDARERGEVMKAERRRAVAHDAATSELRELEAEIRRRRKQLRGAALQAGQDGQAAPDDAAAREFAKGARGAVARGRVPKAPAAGSVPETIEVGDRVLVEALGAEGEVIAIKGNRVTVQLPLAKTTVERSGLRARSRPKRPVAPRPAPMPSQAGRHFGADAKPVDASHDNAFDLRGQRAEDALSMLESFLDRALGADQEVVILRHGHGSGALRRALREHLPRLPHVRTHRAGLPGEGGDAVTVVWMKG
ncbi:MAG: Smr/MutS family protein, partial [Nannocystaceae bacterium]